MTNYLEGTDVMQTGSAPTITKDVVLLQTSDAHSRYFDMLKLTSQTVRAYCELHDFHQSVFVGLKRGSRTWHATYNRIDLLCELVDSKYRGWVLYMDADAWIADLSVDLRGYLCGLGRYSVVGTSARCFSDSYWNMNIGILLLNLGHPFSSTLIHEWRELLSMHNLEEEAIEWSVDILDDQAMFHKVLRRNKHARSCVLQVDKGFMNTPRAKFIRQAIRAEHADFDKRLEYVAEEVEKVLSTRGGRPDAKASDAKTNVPS